MNKKIFTLLVGALLSFGSLFTASAQTPTVHHKVPGQVNFADTLRADTVRTLGKVGAYYLLSITDIANPNPAVMSDVDLSRLTQKATLSRDTSYVLFVDGAGQLRFDAVSNLEFRYGFPQYEEKSDKFAAIRRASWCVEVNKDYKVPGSNAIYDFTNLELNKLLESPLNSVNPGLWNTAEGHGRTVYAPLNGIDLNDEDLIVSGWHFSQTYDGQTLQTGMPLYSYVERDSVLVFVIDDADYIPTSGDGLGGWKVTVKYVAVNDLIADEKGNVRIGGSNAVENVLLFTLKKLDRFVLNANDFNAINDKITFEPDARNAKPENEGWNPFTKSGTEDGIAYPHAKGPLTAVEVNDSLYRYGYLQLSRSDNEWLYVDTARFVNIGNDEFLAFNWSPLRRDTGIVKWGASALRHAEPSSYYKNIYPEYGKPDSIDYYKETDYVGYAYSWRLDSVLWAFFDYFIQGQGVSIESDGTINKYTSLLYNSLTLNDILGPGGADLWDGIINGLLPDAAALATSFSGVGAITIDNLFTNVDYSSFYLHSVPDTRTSNAFERTVAFHSDSLLFVQYYPFEFALDSIMENQSKFRVVYDPYEDSTYINVYQSRVRYTDRKDPQHPIAYPWWKNSFYWDGTTFTPNDRYPTVGDHSLQGRIGESSPKGMDTVVISTADTNVFYLQDKPLSYIYGWNVTRTGTSGVSIKDSLFYVDIQNLGQGLGGYRIATLDEARVGDAKQLSTWIQLKFADRCDADKSAGKASIKNDLYLIRNEKGEYLCVPIYSITDSVYWRTPDDWEDPTRMPSYQWVVENMRASAGSPFRLTNREFKHVTFEYVQVLNELANMKIGDAKYSGAGFVHNKFARVHPDLPGSSLGKGKFADTKTPAFDINKYSFLPLDGEVKGDQLLGYEYIDRDAAYMNIYAFKYLHFLATGADANYLGWNGYKDSEDLSVYVNRKVYNDKLYFALEEIPYRGIGDSKIHLGYDPNGNKSKDLDDYRSIYNARTASENYGNLDSIIMENFGYMPEKRQPKSGESKYDFDVVPGLKPLARQAYRFLLKDDYKFTPSIQGDYMTVGEQDKYVLSDAANISVPGPGKVAGLFGRPYFYFRNTYFDVEGVADAPESYFALVQRLDTINNGTFLPYEDLYRYLYLKWGTAAADRITKQIRDSRELGAFIATVDDYSSGLSNLKIAVRGDVAVAPSTFKLEIDTDPLYRRFHWNDRLDRTYEDNPLVLEFHRLNQDEYKLFENGGSDDRSGGGKEYNLNKRNQLQRDSLNNIISFLGVKNAEQFKPTTVDAPFGNTNYAIYVDTAYINRGTGWIKPQYLLAVDCVYVAPCKTCTGNNVETNYRGYTIGRYLYNTSMYAKQVEPGSIDNGIVNYDLTQPINDEVINTAIKSKYASDYDGYVYTRSGNTKWERLAFAWAIHRGDSLYVLKGAAPQYGEDLYDAEALRKELGSQYGGAGTSNNVDFKLLETFNGKPIPSGKTIGLHAIIDLGDNTHKDWVFSFRFVERGADDFLIESETDRRDRVNGPMIRPFYGGWVKYDNNVPIITRASYRELIGEGYITNVKETAVRPVSNDPVGDVTSGVQVIGGDGAVAILNAAGKSVVITNALGQTLANIVAGSDNASVSVTSGIVFVSVDGGKAVRALVK